MNKFKHLSNIETNIELVTNALSYNHTLQIDLPEGSLVRSEFTEEYLAKRKDLQRRFLNELKGLLVEEKKRTLQEVMEEEND